MNTTARIGKTPFIVADLADAAAVSATIRYTTGFNCSGTNRHEVLQHICDSEGDEACYVIMRGLSSAKAAAIAMILNAPENK